jgi:hypothetical protein
MEKSRQDDLGNVFAAEFGEMLDKHLEHGIPPLLVLKVLESIKVDLWMLLTRQEIQAAFGQLQAGLAAHKESAPPPAPHEASDYLT